MEEYFLNFKSTAFRLEMRQTYKVDSEREDFNTFVKTGKINTASHKPWIDIITAAKKRKAIMQRIHVIQQPLTQYLEYELALYKLNERAGEKITLITQEDYDSAHINPTGDFWIFDDKIVLKMHYDESGVYQGYTLLTENIEPFIKAKQKLLTLKGTGLSHFAKTRKHL